MSRYYYGFPEYVPVAQKRAQAARKLKELRRKRPDIQPVILEGGSIARTWWGKSWNNNLERYADYSNRIGRGRSYVRHGAVLDLRIEPGKISGLVQGSETDPYEVAVSIAALDRATWKRVRETAEGQLDSLAELLAGKFPKQLQELFFAQDEGLFPAPTEIDFSCSCPDWASMCKHVAATLYGVGARLDEKPNLFFDLRQIEVDDLISQAVKGTTRALLKKAGTRSSRVMEDADLTDVFGIELEDFGAAGQRPSGGPGEKAASARQAKQPRKGKEQGEKRVAAKKAKTVKSAKKQAAPQEVPRKAAKTAKTARKETAPGRVPREAATRKKAPEKSTTRAAKAPASRPSSEAKSAARRAASIQGGSRGGTFVDLVIAAIPTRRKKVSIADICARVDLSATQVRNAAARAVVQGRLRSHDRGIYFRP